MLSCQRIKSGVPEGKHPYSCCNTHEGEEQGMLFLLCHVVCSKAHLKGREVCVKSSCILILYKSVPWFSELIFNNADMHCQNVSDVDQH